MKNMDANHIAPNIGIQCPAKVSNTKTMPKTNQARPNQGKKSMTPQHTT